MLDEADASLPPPSAALARFASTMTAEPWSLTRAHVDDLAAHGYGHDAVEAAIGVVAMFNYLTRVADASGIEFDYDSPLPQFTPQRDRQPVPRPPRDAWPEVAGPQRDLPGSSEMAQAWQDWRAYVFDSDQPLTRRERHVLARAAAEECCDRCRADDLAGYAPQDDREARLDAFARKLSLRPWQMGPEDLETLRADGRPEVALLHAIAAVALQNAESRIALARRLLTG